jgi:hypothetical protein
MDGFVGLPKREVDGSGFGNDGLYVGTETFTCECFGGGDGEIYQMDLTIWSGRGMNTMGLEIINVSIKSVSTLFYHLRATSLCFGDAHCSVTSYQSNISTRFLCDSTVYRFPSSLTDYPRYTDKPTFDVFEN